MLFYHFVTGTGGAKRVFPLSALKPGLRLDVSHRMAAGAGEGEGQEPACLLYLAAQPQQALCVERGSAPRRMPAHQLCQTPHSRPQPTTQHAITYNNQNRRCLSTSSRAAPTS